MAPRPVAKPSVARVDAGATRAPAVAKDRPVMRRAQTPGLAPQRAQLLSNKALDFQWFERNLRKYPVQPLPPQAAKISRRSVTAEAAQPKDTPPGSPAIVRAAIEEQAPRRALAPAPWPQTVEPKQLTLAAVRVAVASSPEQGPAQPERGGLQHDAPKTPAELAAPIRPPHTREASPVRWHGAAPQVRDLPLKRLVPEDRAPAKPLSSAPAAKPGRGKGMQALKDTVYLPFRLVNLALATLATVVTLGKAKPLLDYSVDRVGESLVGFARTLSNVLRVTQLPEVLGMDSPRPRSTAEVTGRAPAMPLAPRRPAQAPKNPAPEQRLKSLRENTDIPKRTARMTALVINQMGRAVTTSVGLGGMVVASMAITAVMPPLGLLMFGLTALGAWTAAANLKCAAKNLRSLQRGDPTLPVGSSAAANAWFRGIAHKPQFRSPEGREAARRQAAQGAKMLTLLNAGVQMAGSLASGVAAAPVVIGLFVKKLAPGLSSAVMGWVAETVASRVGARLRADAERDAWASFDQLMDGVRRSHQLPGTKLTAQLQAELRAWGIHDEDLNAWLALTTADATKTKLRPRDDEAGMYLKQMTDQNFAATLLRNAAVAMINFR